MFSLIPILFAEILEKDDWKWWILLTPIILISLLIVSLLLSIWLAVRVVLFVWVLFGILLHAFFKSIVFLIIVIPHIILVIFTIFVPYLGRASLRAIRPIKVQLDVSNLIDESEFARELMVEVVAEHDDRDPKYQLEESYKEKIIEERERGKRHLAIGESLLSFTIGGSLLGFEILGKNPLNTTLYGYSASWAIQFGLFVLALSILYRVTVLEFFSFSDDVKFSSLPEYDAALSFQKGISRLVSIQSLIFPLCIGLLFADYEKKTIQEGLRMYYGDATFQELLVQLWQNHKSDE